MKAHTGKLVPMHFEGETSEERYKNAYEYFGFKRSDLHDSWGRIVFAMKVIAKPM